VGGRTRSSKQKQKHNRAKTKTCKQRRHWMQFANMQIYI
jgi:hypothetical protein